MERDALNDDSRPNGEWYADGLRFSCTQCGNCCTGPPGAVWVNADEIRALADRLGLSVEAFCDQYTRRVGNRVSLTEHRTEFGMDCVFLDRSRGDGKVVCGVYEDRPGQCRTFPFWPEHLDKPRSWQQLERMCPGVNRGQLVPVEEIRIRRDSPASSW